MLNEKPMTGAIGVDVAGVDLAVLPGEALAAAPRHALARAGVLVVRGQRLDLDARPRLTTAFGVPVRLPYIRAIEGRPEMIRVHERADDRGGVFGGDWHAGLSLLERPPAGTALAASVVPPWGGDTLQTSGAAAWDALAGPLRDLLRGRDATNVGEPYSVRWAPPEDARAAVPMMRGDAAADEERRHPAVPRRPHTGREALFLNPLHVTRLDGLNETESRALPRSGAAPHPARPEFGLRLRLALSTVAVWDTLATQHYAVSDHAVHERLMHRTTFAGPAPCEMAAA